MPLPQLDTDRGVYVFMIEQKKLGETMTFRQVVQNFNKFVLLDARVNSQRRLREQIESAREPNSNSNVDRAGATDDEEKIDPRNLAHGSGGGMHAFRVSERDVNDVESSPEDFNELTGLTGNAFADSPDMLSRSGPSVRQTQVPDIGFNRTSNQVRESFRLWDERGSLFGTSNPGQQRDHHHVSRPSQPSFRLSLSCVFGSVV